MRNNTSRRNVDLWRKREKKCEERKTFSIGSVPFQCIKVATTDAKRKEKTRATCYTKKHISEFTSTARWKGNRHKRPARRARVNWCIHVLIVQCAGHQRSVWSLSMFFSSENISFRRKKLRCNDLFVVQRYWYSPRQRILSPDASAQDVTVRRQVRSCRTFVVWREKQCSSNENSCFYF